MNGYTQGLWGGISVALETLWERERNCLIIFIIFISAPLRFAALGLCECWPDLRAQQRRRLLLMEAQNLTLRENS